MMFDPSKMDPKVMMELSTLIRQLPPHQLTRMQSMMHNMMAGFDVSREMAEFEQTLPPGFREKVTSLMMAQPGFVPPTAGGMATAEQPSSGGPMDMREARLTVFRAVAAGEMSPEDAERLLFPA